MNDIDLRLLCHLVQLSYQLEQSYCEACMLLVYGQ